MSRSGYDDGGENLALYRGMVASAIRGKRGQALLRELRDTLDAMPEKKLTKDYIMAHDGVCALGAVGQRRGLDMIKLDSSDNEVLAETFNVATCLIQEIEHINDEWGGWNQTPEARWRIVREWVEQQVTKGPTP